MIPPIRETLNRVAIPRKILGLNGGGDGGCGETGSVASIPPCVPIMLDALRLARGGKRLDRRIHVVSLRAEGILHEILTPSTRFSLLLLDAFLAAGRATLIIKSKKNDDRRNDPVIIDVREGISQPFVGLAFAAALALSDVRAIADALRADAEKR